MLQIISVPKACILGSKKMLHAQWVSFDTPASNEGIPTQLTLEIGVVSIQIEEDFNLKYPKVQQIEQTIITS